jgi:RimJ/RimL family protein N-acetyltransferase
MVIETPRLLLRPWRNEDAPALFRYARDPLVGSSAGWMPHTSVAHSRSIIRDILSRPETYAVVLKSTDEPIGTVSLLSGQDASAPLAAGEAELGYWLGVPYWGQGLIPEAVEALLTHCFRDLALAAVWCASRDGNRKSMRVQEKCGFLFHHSALLSSPLEGDRLTHFTRQTREQWLARTGQSVTPLSSGGAV